MRVQLLALRFGSGRIGSIAVVRFGCWTITRWALDVLQSKMCATGEQLAPWYCFAFEIARHDRKRELRQAREGDVRRLTCKTSESRWKAHHRGKPTMEYIFLKRLVSQQ